MRWNCVHVCQQVLGSCSQSSSTQFDSVGHWKEPHSEWWGDAHARCGRNSKGNGRGSLWLYFHDFWCTLLMFYCTSCPITSIRSSREVILLLGLTSYQFPISNRTTVSSDSVPLTGWNLHNAHGPTSDSGAGWSAKRYCVGCLFDMPANYQRDYTSLNSCFRRLGRRMKCKNCRKTHAMLEP